MSENDFAPAGDREQTVVTMSRAGLLAAFGALPVLAAAGCAGPTGTSRDGRASETKLVILGTAGGPVPALARNMTSHVIVDDGIAYVIDCGLGVTSQLVRAGVSLAAVRHVFLTHHHPDHTLNTVRCYCSRGSPADDHRSRPTGRRHSLK